VNNGFLSVYFEANSYIVGKRIARLDDAELNNYSSNYYLFVDTREDKTDILYYILERALGQMRALVVP
jgi:hypothetical protein